MLATRAECIYQILVLQRATYYTKRLAKVRRRSA